MSEGIASALPRTCRPTVWLWPGQALYAGPGLGLAPHSGSVYCLAVGVDEPLTVAVGPVVVRATSVLIPPRTVHRLDTHGGRMVTCYLEPASGRIPGCRSRFRELRGELAAAHDAEDRLRHLPGDDRDARRWLDLAAPPSGRRIDERIARTARRIRHDPAAAASSRDLAAEAGLSVSRFLHLFSHEMGTSLRRYRMWVRLTHAGAVVAAGGDLTAAAAEAGFASPSHLADRFRTTFGLSASALLSTGVVVRIP